MNFGILISYSDQTLSYGKYSKIMKIASKILVSSFQIGGQKWSFSCSNFLAPAGLAGPTRLGHADASSIFPLRIRRFFLRTIGLISGVINTGSGDVIRG